MTYKQAMQTLNKQVQYNEATYTLKEIRLWRNERGKGQVSLVLMDKQRNTVRCRPEDVEIERDLTGW